MMRRTFIQGSVAAASSGAQKSGSHLGLAIDSVALRGPKDGIELLELARSFGALGIQTSLPPTDRGFARRLRDRAAKLGMSVEASYPLPVGENTEFAGMLAAAKEAGAVAVRIVCLPGRRYEVFQDLAAWQRFITDCRRAFDRAVPLAEKQRIPLAVENHMDWTADELLAIVRDINSEFFGVCLDVANNIALLDDPYETVEMLAPYAVSTRLKDVLWQATAEGFLLSDAALGQGYLDLKRIVSAIRKARPQSRFTLATITRDPLPVRCLADEYWATFPDRSGIHLARTIRMVRSAPPDRKLVRLEGLDRGARVRLEENNVRESFRFAREQLGF